MLRRLRRQASWDDLRLFPNGTSRRFSGGSGSRHFRGKQQPELHRASYKSGWLFGERFNADLTRRGFSTEASLVRSSSNRLLPWPFGQVQRFASIGAEKYSSGTATLVYHFQPRTANTRFFVLAGPAASSGINPAVHSGPSAVGNFVQPTFPPGRDRDEPALTYGIACEALRQSFLWGRSLSTWVEG